MLAHCRSGMLAGWWYLATEWNVIKCHTSHVEWNGARFETRPGTHHFPTEPGVEYIMPRAFPINLGSEEHATIRYSLTIGMANRSIPAHWFPAVNQYLTTISSCFGIAVETGDKKKLLHLQGYTEVRAPPGQPGSKVREDLYLDPHQNLGACHRNTVSYPTPQLPHEVLDKLLKKNGDRS